MWLHYTTLDTKMFNMAKNNRNGEMWQIIIMMYSINVHTKH